MTASVINTNHLILLAAAEKLGIKTEIIQSKPVKIKYTFGDRHHVITEKSFGLNHSQKAKDISHNKSLTIKTLAQTNLPVPQQLTINNSGQYSKCITIIPFPQVIKPLAGEKGKDVFLNINNQQSGQQAINQILDYYLDGAIVETYHHGNDYRFLALNHQVIGLAQRLPPKIEGDGQHTIKRLIEIENDRRSRLNQQVGKRMLNRMHNWKRISWNLHRQNLSLKTILPRNKTIILYPIANFSTGGSTKTIDIKTIHPSLFKLAKKVSQVIGLEIIGIDMLIKNLQSPAKKDNVVIIEVNSDPGIRLHDWPNQGQSQHVAEAILKSIFNL